MPPYPEWSNYPSLGKMVFQASPAFLTPKLRDPVGFRAA